MYAGVDGYVFAMQVIFVGEEAVDAGGVRKEFFLLIMRELLDPKYGMFRYYEESRLIWFANKVHCSIDTFQSCFIPVKCALCPFRKLSSFTLTLCQGIPSSLMLWYSV